MRIRNRQLSLLLLTSLLLTILACSQQSDSNQNDSADAANSTATDATGANSSSPASTIEIEPVMPEKVQAAFEQNCKTCHGPNAHGITGVAPDLRRTARRSLDEWTKFLKDQNGSHSTDKIPAMANLTNADYEAIGGYLADLTQNNSPAK